MMYPLSSQYLNKNNTRKLTRDNFSFSCKWFVGEFNQPSQDKQVRLCLLFAFSPSDPLSDHADCRSIKC